MSTSAGNRAKQFAPPRFEDLEQRLLLTTLYGGNFFVYLNSQGEAVRVGLEGNPTDAVELLSVFDVDDDGTLDLIDLVGLHNGDVNDPLNWPDGPEAVEFDDDGNPSWIDYAAASDTEPEVRGAATEIFAIYVSQATEDTVLTISTLEVTDLDSDDWDPNNINPWESSSLPILFFVAGVPAPYTSPAGSGGGASACRS